MKKALSLVVCLFCVVIVLAQTNYFIYVENSTKQPFSITYNGLTYTGNSHIILSKLKPGSHPLTFTIPGNKPFTITPFLQDEDLGFILRNNNDSWQLQNINTKLILTENNVEPEKTVEPPTEISKSMLNDAKKTEEIIETRAEEVEPKKVEDKPIINPTTTPKPTKTTVDLITPKTNLPKIRKAFENITKGGVDQIYIVPNGNKLDTVAIYLPSEPKPIKETPKQTEVETKKETTATKVDSDNITNPNCSNFFSPEAEGNLRHLLSQPLLDKQKIKITQQTLSIYCITIAQARQLGNYFESDEYRVEFFKSIKNSLTTPYQYLLLEDNIVSDKWKAIFKETVNY